MRTISIRCVLIVMAIVMVSCQSNTEKSSEASTTLTSMQENTTVNTPSERELNGDRESIEAVFDKLEESYMSYLLLEDMPMYDYVENKQSYIDQLFRELETGSVAPHLSQAFLQQIRTELENCAYDSQILKSIRQCAEPIFKCTRIHREITVNAIDAEADEAIVVAHSGGKDGWEACKVSFLLNKVDNVWRIQSREVLGKSARDNEESLTPVSGEQYGIFTHPTDPSISYRIWDVQGVPVLQKCQGENCTEIGKIMGTRANGAQAELVVKGISGEMVPHWSISGGTMYVHDYDAETDTWTDLEYQLEDAAG